METMIVYCPGCGPRIAAESAVNDPKRMVTCPKCQSRFSAAGVTVGASTTQSLRRFRPKKTGGGRGAAIAVSLGALLLIAGAAAALYYSGVFDRTPSNASLAAKSTTSGPAWAPYESAEGKFKILLPGKPVRKVRSPKETELSLETADLKIGVVFANLSSKDKPEKHMVAPAGSKILHERDIELSGFHGRDIAAEVPGHGVSHMRFLTNGQRLYTVLVVGKNGQSPSDSVVARVFDSFQITG